MNRQTNYNYENGEAKNFQALDSTKIIVGE